MIVATQDYHVTISYHHQHGASGASSVRWALIWGMPPHQYYTNINHNNLTATPRHETHRHRHHYNSSAKYSHNMEFQQTFYTISIFSWHEQLKESVSLDYLYLLTNTSELGKWVNFAKDFHILLLRVHWDIELWTIVPSMGWERKG